MVYDGKKGELNMPQTVLITGTGRPYALGFNLVKRYLENGDCVFASIRRGAAVEDLLVPRTERRIERERREQEPDRRNGDAARATPPVRDPQDARNEQPDRQHEQHENEKQEKEEGERGDEHGWTRGSVAGCDG